MAAPTPRSPPSTLLRHTIVLLAAVTISYLTAQNLGLPHLAAFQHPWWVRPAEVTRIFLAAASTWSRHRQDSR